MSIIQPIPAVKHTDDRGRIITVDNFDYRKMEDEITTLFRDVLDSMPDNAAREGLQETPRRVARAYCEFFRGYSSLPFEPKDFDSGYDGLIVRKHIPFVAHCEHHICPFPGIIDFAYVPAGKVLGLSKIIRFMQHYTSRLWIQEDMTNFLIDEFMKLVEPKGAAIIVEACHSCEGYRGVREPNVPTITAAVRGIFAEDKILEGKFYTLVGR
ncbi:MAG: GTP cyclohydrolase I FolE [Methanogenium sp.]